MIPVNLRTKVGGFALDLITDKRSADATYLRLMPALKYVVNTRGRGSTEAKGLFDILAALPQTGAKRRNFEKEYIAKPDGWKDLPSDPNQIPFGFWH